MNYLLKLVRLHLTTREPVFIYQEILKNMETVRCSSEYNHNTIFRQVIQLVRVQPQLCIYLMKTIILLYIQTSFLYMDRDQHLKHLAFQICTVLQIYRN
uniref:Uncharacterized protein n=1 Tax=Podoviridae sp. ctG4L18 TaxID=2825234 RepID=A0A8S5UNV3_9CAUD|nr:MAG TPA: hypothetical protein [Podoviridae sp. ctG4L18]